MTEEERATAQAEGGPQFWEGDPIRVILTGGEIVDGQFVSGTTSNFDGITIETW